MEEPKMILFVVLKFAATFLLALVMVDAHSEQDEKDVLTQSSGIPIADKLNILTAGPRGPVLLQDTVYIDEIAHFDRERIPERVVHAKGTGAFGYFEVTKDITQYSRADVFSKVGKKTPIAVRFSTVIGSRGSSETVRDVRGFAVKFYTDQGNWDLLGLHIPVFTIRDPIILPSFIHSQGRNPVTNLQDADMAWDFFSLRPESTNLVVRLFSDHGIPLNYRFMNGFAINTFKLVNKNNAAVYCKFHYKSNQGVKFLSVQNANKLAGTDPDYATRDLYVSIEKKNYPSWTLYIQVMTFHQAENYKFNPFDATKVWPEAEFPLIEVGKLTLNRNPKDHFAEVEQAAFTASNMVPGIEPSPDKILQGRLFVYGDTQRYRLGANFMQLPVNCPYNNPASNYQREGQYSYKITDPEPNYYPNSFDGPVDDHSLRPPPFPVSGDVARYETVNEDNFSQAGIFYREELDNDGRTRLADNLANSLREAEDFIQERAFSNFCQADRDLGQRLLRRRLKVSQRCG